MNVIKIDTANNLITKVLLTIDKDTFEVEEKRTIPGDQNVLELIEAITKEHGLHLTDINSIEVNDGPGSFTGLRVGAAISNALAFSMQISVNGKAMSEIVEPQY